MKFLENGQEIDSKNLVISFGHVLCFFQGATERLKSDAVVTARNMDFWVGPPARKSLLDCVFSLKFVWKYAANETEQHKFATERVTGKVLPYNVKSHKSQKSRKQQ